MRREDGQAAVMTLLFLTVLLGMAGAVIDVGSWYQSERQAQSTADAAALAGAQGLPDVVSAKGYALDYAGRNKGGVLAADVTFLNGFEPSDTIKVKVNRTEPSFFTKIFGIDSVTVHAKASARAASPDQVRWAAPIVVNKLHPEISGPGCPCFNVPTTIPLAKNGAPGAFDLVNLDGSRGGISPAILADWITRGFDKYLALGGYYSDPGAKFNSSHMQEAFTSRLGSELLFPVYDTLTGNGANARYDVIGWIGFRLTSFDARGSSGSLAGYFTRVIWDGIQNTTKSSAPDYGVHTIALID